MTGQPVVVNAQWALCGQPPGTDGERVLACSAGDLSMANFTDAIGRFQLGHLDNLPQVSVSYLMPAGQPDGSYVALTIHRKSDTRYFCVPYRPLAAEAVTYHAMYQAVRGIRLPADRRRPLRIEISQGRYGPTLDPLAMRIAALLLTGTPVCVLNAEDTTVDDRLAFTDCVMALLPHGFRARMAAATWTRATFRDHKFRLYFSAAPRQGDYVAHWRRPDDVVIPDGPARDYLEQLEKSAGPLIQLSSPAETSADLKFDPRAAARALELISTPWTAASAVVFSALPHSLGVADLIDLVGREGYGRPQDFRGVCDALVRRLKESPAQYRPPEVRRALRKHGFLAGVLAANESADEEYQVRTLHEFVLAAYPSGLAQPDIRRILTGAESTPTPALLAAVCLCLSDRADVELAQRAYIHGSITRMGLDASTYVRLAPYIPDLGGSAADVEESEQ